MCLKITKKKKKVQIKELCEGEHICQFPLTSKMYHANIKCFIAGEGSELWAGHVKETIQFLLKKIQVIETKLIFALKF